jgi:hypothetical protein
MISLNAEVLESAFGRPGERGDAATIDHTAAYLMDATEELLDWSARLRGTAVPTILGRSFELAAELTTQPLNEIYVFTDQILAENDRIPAMWGQERSERVVITLTLKLTMDKRAMDDFTREMDEVSSQF